MASDDWSVERLSSVCASNKFMFESKDNCDLEIVVVAPSGGKDRTSKSPSIRAHRYVLMSRSPVLNRMFRANKKLKRIDETDVPLDALTEFLRYLYCEDVQLTLGNALHVLRAAKKYEVAPLEGVCLRFMRDSITVDEVCTLLEHCVLLDNNQLTAECLEFISRRTRPVLQSRSFLTLSLNTLRLVVGLEKMNVPEVELFEACVSWARGKCVPPADQDSHVRQKLEPLIPLIRFAAMSEDQIKRRVLAANVMNDAELGSIFKKLVSPQSGVDCMFRSTIRPGAAGGGDDPGGGAGAAAGRLYPRISTMEKMDSIREVRDSSPSAPRLTVEFDKQQ